MKDWTTRRVGGQIVVTFGEVVSPEAGRGSAQEVARLLEESHEKVVLVVDARATDRYAPQARTVWQALLSVHRPRIRRLVVVTESAMVRIGAGLMEYALGAPVEVRTTLPRDRPPSSRYSLTGARPERVEVAPARRSMMPTMPGRPRPARASGGARTSQAGRASGGARTSQAGRSRRSVTTTRPKR